jgi:transposase
MARFDLTDFEWSVIEPLLPTKVRGVARVDDAGESHRLIGQEVLSCTIGEARPPAVSASSSASAWVGDRILCAQLWTVVMRERRPCAIPNATARKLSSGR